MRAPGPPSLGDGGAGQNQSKLVMALSRYVLSPLRAHLQEDLQRQSLRSADRHQDAEVSINTQYGSILLYTQERHTMGPRVTVLVR